MEFNPVEPKKRFPGVEASYLSEIPSSSKLSREPLREIRIEVFRRPPLLN